MERKQVIEKLSSLKTILKSFCGLQNEGEQVFDIAINALKQMDSSYAGDDGALSLCEPLVRINPEEKLTDHDQFCLFNYAVQHSNYEIINPAYCPVVCIVEGEGFEKGKVYPMMSCGDDGVDIFIILREDESAGSACNEFCPDGLADYDPAYVGVVPRFTYYEADPNFNDVTSVTPKPAECEDAVSRQSVIKTIAKYDFDFPQYMERFVTELRDAMKEDLQADVVKLPPVTPKLTECEDAVSRQDVINSYCNRCEGKKDCDKEKCYNTKWIRKLPSVAPIRKTGRWVQDSNGSYHCSVCGCVRLSGKENFCPNCGVKMDTWEPIPVRKTYVAVEDVLGEIDGWSEAVMENGHMQTYADLKLVRADIEKLAQIKQEPEETRRSNPAACDESKAGMWLEWLERDLSTRDSWSKLGLYNFEHLDYACEYFTAFLKQKGLDASDLEERYKAVTAENRRIEESGGYAPETDRHELKRLDAELLDSIIRAAEIVKKYAGGEK